MVTIKDMRKIYRIIKNAKVKKPRTLPRVGTGGLHSEQQFCFEKGYNEARRETKRAVMKALMDADEWDKVEE
jgi:hypothetical protein